MNTTWFTQLVAARQRLLEEYVRHVSQANFTYALLTWRAIRRLDRKIRRIEGGTL